MTVRSPARALLCLASLCLLVVLPACSRRAPEGGGATPVKLALDWVPEPEFGGFYAARESGAFEKEGLSVTIQGGGAGTPVVQMVAAGQVDFGIAGADEVLTARARGADVVPVFATFQTSPQGIMVHASRKAATLGEVLSGGTLALEPGANWAAFVKRKYGFEHVQVLPYDGGVARFLADPSFAQQCYVTSEPIAARRKGSDPKVFLIADEGWNPYVGVVITRRALWAEKPALVRSFVRAVRAGWRAYLDGPAAANAVMAKANPAMDAETFAAAAEAQKALIETDETRKHGLGSMTKARWETLGQQLASLGVIDKAPSGDELMVAAPE